MADPQHPFLADPWLSGFTDGEGSFTITWLSAVDRAEGVRKRLGLAPRFAISLRADDVAVLREAQAALGGSLSFVKGQGRSKPVAAWTVGARRDLPGLVEYFDRFPLRSKKATDYAVWREAVLLHVKARRVADVLAEMTVLRDALVAGRVFEPAEVTAAIDASPVNRG